MIKRWSEDLGNGNWEDRYQTGDGKVYRADGTFLYQE